MRGPWQKLRATFQEHATPEENTTMADPKRVSPHEAKDLLDQGWTYLDVRTPAMSGRKACL